ncbi:hypothetical protein NLJ89_g2583 [Agrocybe chaxingu]|uniref:Uncharacterized protein n=1 Tax=Agrocybe chaxingu TaxID=84603 RepID=A0A9W8MYU1_9AGAR|nr:hypothetical protein NLJ89_g2583 [Agrocybe chaxingu]
MATILDVPAALGDYMLKGWVLTDRKCPTLGCTVPLVRSPNGRTPVVSLCVKCDAEVPQAAQPPNISTLTASSASSESDNSRSSTPPTEFSQASSSPVYELPPETDESRRRREQSDQASSEIGKRLLRGWAMLGDECPNNACFGVPLVRPPRSASEKDPRKECVICGTIYTAEVDWAGRERLIPYETKSVVADNVVPFSQTNNSQTQQLSGSASILPPIPTTNSLTLAVPLEQNHKSESPLATLQKGDNPRLDDVNSSLDVTARALGGSLQSLSSRLIILSSCTALDPASVAATADAIGKVTKALTENRNNHGEKTLPGPSSVAQTEQRVKGQRKLRKSSLRGQNPLLPVPGGPSQGVDGAAASSHKANSSHTPGVPMSASSQFIGPGGQPFPPPYRMNSFRLMQDNDGRMQSFALEDPGPVVSSYSHGRYPVVQHATSSVAPSRVWSEIPSVHRDSNSAHRTGRASDRATWKDDSSRSLPQQTALIHPQLRRASKASIASSLGTRSSISQQDLRYIEYPSRPPTPARDPEPQNLAVIRSNRQEDANASRSNHSPQRTAAPVVDLDGDSEPEVYNYIIPSGKNVIFLDEEGMEITRISKTGLVHHMNQRTKNTPIIVYDQFGKLLYRDPLPPPRRRNGLDLNGGGGGVQRTNSQLRSREGMPTKNASTSKK